MKTKFFLLAIVLVISSFTKSSAQDGKSLFKANCGVCHTVGKGKLVGPDLKGVDTRYDEAWLLKWIKSSQALVKSGDQAAVKVFDENNKLVMPDMPLNDDEIKAVLSYVKSIENEPPKTAASQVAGPSNTGSAHGGNISGESHGTLLTMFTFTEYLLMMIIGMCVVVIWVLGMTIKTLSAGERS